LAKTLFGFDIFLLADKSKDPAGDLQFTYNKAKYLIIA